MRAVICWFCLSCLAWAMPLTAAAQDKEVPASKAALELSFAPLVKQVAPSVVNIFSKRKVQQRSLSTLFDDPFFQRFFGRGFGGFGLPRERIQSSLGSGVIVSPEGLVVTNHHVIEGAAEIIVVLSDRREFAAEIVVDDKDTDLAVLKVAPPPEDLPYLELRDSDTIEVGDLVLAIGNPFGVGQTVTSGIVSALARTQVGIADFNFFIQTDAAINPGNSGGALVTMDGKLAGINTAIYSKSGGSVGIGFAVPSNMVRTVIAGADRGGAVLRAWIGLTGQSLTNELAEGFGLDRGGGVIVSRIFEDGPADEAGLKLGDVILAIDGMPIEDLQSLRFRVATQPIGETAALMVWRAGATIEMKMPLAAAPESPPRDMGTLEGRHPMAGAVVANLSPALAEELDRPGAWSGVIVMGVARGSPAERFRFRKGDIIVTVNDAEVMLVDDLRRALNAADGNWVIRFNRNGRMASIEIGEP